MFSTAVLYAFDHPVTFEKKKYLILFIKEVMEILWLKIMIYYDYECFILLDRMGYMLLI